MLIRHSTNAMGCREIASRISMSSFTMVYETPAGIAGGVAYSGDGDRRCRWSQRSPRQSANWPHLLSREAKPFDDGVQQLGMAAVDRGLLGRGDKRHGSVDRCDRAQRRLGLD